MYGTAEERRAARLATATRPVAEHITALAQTERDHTASHASSSASTIRANPSRPHGPSNTLLRPRANTNDSDQTIMSLPWSTTQAQTTAARRAHDAASPASRASAAASRAAVFAEPFEFDSMTSRGRVVVDRERTAAGDRETRTGESRTPTPTTPSATRTATALSVVREALRERRAAAAPTSTTTTTDRPWRTFANNPSGGGTTLTETIASRRRNSPGGGIDIPTLNERTPLFLPIDGRRRGSNVVPLDRDEFPTLTEANTERVREMAEEVEVFTAVTMGDQMRLPAPAQRVFPTLNHSSETPRVMPLTTTTMNTTPASDTPRTPNSPTPVTTMNLMDASFTPRAIAELRALQNTVTRLNDRLEIARGNMAMLALARSSLRSRDEREGMTGGRISLGEAQGLGGEGSRSLNTASPFTGSNAVHRGAVPGADISRDASPHQQLARRPSFPYTRSVHHPHMRPRLSPQPIAFVLNIDNVNSFDVNFDGTIVFRPNSAREPGRELVARCLSMLPGGRDGTQSRWMRLTGNSSSRPRRASPSAGYWVRWVSEVESVATGIRHRAVDMTLLPRIIGFDFATTPPDDDAFVRADEIEFMTPLTRLRSHLGPWMHSRVRIEPFESDLQPASWGTSAHVRQSARGLGSLTTGHFMRYQIRERRAELHPGNSMTAATARLGDTSASTSRIGLERVLDSYESLGMTITSDSVPAIRSTQQSSSATPDTNRIGATSDPESAWLMSFEPAIGQIRASWRAHFRRTRDDAPLVGSAVFPDTRAPGSRHASQGTARHEPGANTTGLITNSSTSRSDSHEMWSREYLDENGIPHPALPVNELVQSVRQEEWQNELARRLSESGSRERSRTPSQGTPPHINYV
ncbi:hypothetical protein QFC21_005538 [Naganishia friedmannii]|uniref:Uncharacterized protein n=1 Tax=Naganishia friedmannii TaxID=89922 RepID=A0ACC2VAM7_9TREE|nr:hypothetical protein QFC21_005538 [Naganishia friedmannii]